MNPLYLQYQSTNVLNLDGLDPAETVIRSCKILPGTSADSNLVRLETIELYLEGTWAQITAKISALEHYTGLAANSPIPGDHLYLRYFESGLYDWRSQVLFAWLELGRNGLADRDQESQLVKLHISRLDYWAAPKTLLDLAQDISSHTDAEHSNSFLISGQGLEADLPSPIEFHIENTESEDPFRDFVISQRQLPVLASVDVGFIEGEDLTAGGYATLTTPADADCSAGAYGSFEWTGEDETLLGYWTPSAADLAIMRGQVHRPILRLQAANTYTDLWLRLKVHSTSTVTADEPYIFATSLQESLWMLAPLNNLYVELPPINLPPILTGRSSYRPIYVAIYARRVAGGTSTLAVDFVQFTPAETIRRLSNLRLDMPVGAGNFLVDSGIDQATFYQDDTGAIELSHVGQGSYLQIIPGYDSFVRVLHRPPDTSIAWDINVLFNFHIYYEPRRRNL